MPPLIITAAALDAAGRYLGDAADLARSEAIELAGKLGEVVFPGPCRTRSITGAAGTSLTISEDLIVGRLNLEGSLSVGAELRASEDLSIGGDLRVRGNLLHARGSRTGGAPLQILVKGACTTGGDLDAGGDVVIESGCSIGGNAMLFGDLRVGGSLAIGGWSVVVGAVRSGGLIRVRLDISARFLEAADDIFADQIRAEDGVKAGRNIEARRNIEVGEDGIEAEGDVIAGARIVADGRVKVRGRLYSFAPPSRFTPFH